MSSYDPHEIVIYSLEEKVSDKMVDGAKQRLRKDYPTLNLPKLVLSRNFNDDYLKGLISLGMKELND